MSIYYLGADEYPQEGEYANSTMARVEWKIDTPDVPDHSRTGSSRSGNKQKSINGNVSEKVSPFGPLPSTVHGRLSFFVLLFFAHRRSKHPSYSGSVQLA